jgi:hypothetical protein
LTSAKTAETARFENHGCEILGIHGLRQAFGAAIRFGHDWRAGHLADFLRTSAAIPRLRIMAREIALRAMR